MYCRLHRIATKSRGSGKKTACSLRLPAHLRRQARNWSIPATAWSCAWLSIGLGSSRISTFFIDFIGGKTGYRHLRNCTINQPLARAAGIRPGFRPTVFDATAGMGGDAFVLACLGCRVVMNERSAVIAALLQDAIDRALVHPETAEIFLHRLSLTTGDARTTMHRAAGAPPYHLYRPDVSAPQHIRLEQQGHADPAPARRR